MTPENTGFRRGLFVLLVLGLAQQAWLLADHWAHNPFARTPLDDARVYWSWAEEIARGRMVGDTPFLSAPLYPYLLGLVRAAGGGLLAVYALQGMMRLAAAALLALLGRRLMSPMAGLACALLFLLLDDPAAASGRVLNESLQVLLATVLLWECLRAPWPRQPWLLGLLLGLNALANPPMLAAIPVLAWWIGRGGNWRQGAGAAAVALLALAPATAHNLAACGEFILVSGQGGVTFSHGNAAGATGIYHPIAGVSADRVEQNRDAFRLAAEATGTPGWRSTSAYFMRRGLAYWAEQPGAALLLVLRKARWFLSGQHYGDVYLASHDRSAGFWTALSAAPVPVAWIMLPALCTTFVLRRRWRELLPLALMELLPLAVVLVFFYSPRYRLPAVAPATLLAVWSVWHVWQSRRAWLLAPWLAGGALLGLNALQHFDRPRDLAAQYEQKVGAAYLAQGGFGTAEAHFRRALELQPGEPGFTASLGEALRRQGQASQALPALREAVAAHPQDLHLRRTFAVTLAELHVSTREPALAREAEQEFLAVLAQAPGDWSTMDNLGILLHQIGRSDEAAQWLLEARKTAPAGSAVERHLEEVLAILIPYYRAHAADPLAAAAGAWLIAQLPSVEPASLDEALAWATSAVEAEPGNPDFLDTLAAVHGRRGEFAQAVAAARKALEAARDAGRAELALEIETRLAGYHAGRHALMKD